MQLLCNHKLYYFEKTGICRFLSQITINIPQGITLYSGTPTFGLGSCMSFPGAGTDASIRILQHVPLDSGGFGFFVSKRACIYLVAGKIEGSYGKAARLTHRNPHPASAGWGNSRAMVFLLHLLYIWTKTTSLSIFFVRGNVFHGNCLFFDFVKNSNL